MSEHAYIETSPHARELSEDELDSISKAMLRGMLPADIAMLAVNVLVYVSCGTSDTLAEARDKIRDLISCADRLVVQEFGFIRYSDGDTLQ